MTKNIIFDMGNVILKWNPDHIASKFVSTKKEQELLVKVLFQSKEWSMLDQGSISLDEVKKIVKDRLPKYFHHKIDTILDTWYLYLEPIKEMIPLVVSLKKQGCGIYLLSNASIQFKEYYKEVEAFQYFDGFYVSAFHKLSKPDSKIYENFLQVFHLNPKDCFFIDDIKENIIGANNVGIQGYVFDGNIKKLKQVLESFLESGE